MSRGRERRFWGGALSGLMIALALGGGCTAREPGLAHYRYFVAPDADDAWSRKIRRWQSRERDSLEAAEAPAPLDAGPPAREERPEVGILRDKYTAFRIERKREMARELADWIQARAREHYVADGPIDHWATLEETFRRNGDDCDGLELLVFHLLRDLGFGDDEVFRAVVVRREDGQHHMVTLWFEDPEDPWVIDPTGAMTSGMPRMSELPGWVPLKLFTDRRDYTVRPGSLRVALDRD